MRPTPTGSERLERWLPCLAGALALLPFLAYWRSFADLWWFGDDWDLLDQIAHLGFWRWSLRPFAENFEPVFKVLWGGLVFGSHGSYFSLILALWLTHALNVALLAQLLRRVGFGWPGAALVLAGFGLSAANVETLAWSVQWSAVLAVTFFLLAANWQASHRLESRPWRWQPNAILLLLVAASALSFSRGVLTGAALGFMSLVPLTGTPGSWLARLRTAIICLASAAVVMAIIFFATPGNQHDIGRHWREALEFGAYYWGATPLHRLFDPGTWGPRTTAVLGFIKIVGVVWAIRHTSGSQRWLLLLLLVLDVGNATLLGIGRFHTGLPAANGSRYQYTALLCTLPFFAVVFDSLLARVRRPGLRAGAATVCVSLLAFHVSRGWAREAPAFAFNRGRYTRELLLRNPHPLPTGAVPGIDFMSTQRAKELIKIYDLH